MKTLTLNSFLLYRDTQYNDVGIDREDEIIEAGMGLTAMLAKWIFLNLSYRYRTVDSTEILSEYEENKALLTLRLTPSQPFRMNP